jgi:acyl-CoA reductase-like NAD-dependent aldehyde dehydrogenase
VAEGSRIVDEEQSGTALPILTYRTIPEAIDRANATSYRLGGPVWSSDSLRAASVTGKLEAGSAWVNTHMQLTHDAPSPASSGADSARRMGPWNINAYTDPQTVFRTRSPVIKKRANQALDTRQQAVPTDR